MHRLGEQPFYYLDREDRDGDEKYAIIEIATKLSEHFNIHFFFAPSPCVSVSQARSAAWLVVV